MKETISKNLIRAACKIFYNQDDQFGIGLQIHPYQLAIVLKLNVTDEVHFPSASPKSFSLLSDWKIIVRYFFEQCEVTVTVTSNSYVEIVKHTVVSINGFIIISIRDWVTCYGLLGALPCLHVTMGYRRVRVYLT